MARVDIFGTVALEVVQATEYHHDPAAPDYPDDLVHQVDRHVLVDRVAPAVQLDKYSNFHSSVNFVLDPDESLPHHIDVFYV